MTRIVSEDRLNAIAADLLAATGVPDSDATLAARALVFADMRGTTSHGVRLLAANLRRLTGGAANPRPKFETVVALGAIETWDGGCGLGMVCGARAMDRAVELANDHGIGSVLVRRSNHWGASGAYADIAVQSGHFGIAVSNSSPLMAVEGAVVRTIGGNPLAFGAPGPDFPMIFDIAMTVAAGGRVARMRRAGEPVPDEWFIPSSGPDDRPAFRPFGGPKGSGLAVMMEKKNEPVLRLIIL